MTQLLNNIGLKIIIMVYMSIKFEKTIFQKIVYYNHI